MNFNPQNTATLENLLAAMQSGMSGQQAYGVLADTVAQQQQQTAQRQEKMQGYSTTLLDLAGQGFASEEARSIMDLLTPKPGIPRPVENMFPTMYPPAQEALPQGPTPIPYAQYTAAEQAAKQPGGVSPDAQSPVYTENPAVQQQQFENQLAMQPTAPTQAAVAEQKLGELMAAIQVGITPVEAGGRGWTVEQTLNTVAADPAYAGVLTQNITKIMQFLAISGQGAI
jgi:hypothetical protein